MKHVPLFILLLVTTANAEELVKNGDFKTKDKKNPAFPTHWTETNRDYKPCEYGDVYNDGNLAAMLPGDGVARMWRQDVMAPKERSWLLSARVRAENVVIGKGEYARLYGHVIYKDKPYSTATHFHVDFKPGGYDWTFVRVLGGATNDFEIERIHVSILADFSAGKYYVDDVSLTSDRSLADDTLLLKKIDDLSAQLDRVGNVDDSVGRCRGWLAKARQQLTKTPPNIGQATSDWHSAAKMLSHKAWAAMYPDAMSDKTVEAHMVYHGMGRTAAETEKNLDKIQLAGCNAMYLSFGSWMYVNYHSHHIPTEPDWKEFDALTYFIEAAHKRGLKVFGYFAPLYGTRSPRVLPGSIMEKHPDWMAKGPNPQMPVFPDPANPEVVDYLERVYVELATRYKLDGIGLDYIRYPTPNALNYDERNRQAIKKRYGIDIKTHPNVYGDADAWAKIQEYRHENVGRIVKRVHDAIKKARPDIKIMACLISEPDIARDEYGQNWGVSSRWIDYASPMNYDDRCLDVAMLESQKSICRRNKAIWIPALGGMPEVHRTWTISEWARRIAIQRKLDPDGLIVYRLGEFDTAVAAFFGGGPFHRPARFPPSRK